MHLFSFCLSFVQRLAEVDRRNNNLVTSLTRLSQPAETAETRSWYQRINNYKLVTMMDGVGWALRNHSSDKGSMTGNCWISLIKLTYGIIYFVSYHSKKSIGRNMTLWITILMLTSNVLCLEEVWDDYNVKEIDGDLEDDLDYFFDYEEIVMLSRKFTTFFSPVERCCILKSNKWHK